MPLTLSTCRACAAPDLQTVLTLGRTPLANALLDRPDAFEPIYPLELALCPACSLVQLRESVPPQQLFDEYCYFSSFSETMVAHARQLAERLIRERRLGPNSLVIEAASNDGYLLRWYRERGVGVLGIEPARNVARIAREQHHIPTRAKYFTDELAQQLVGEGLVADVFHAHNVLAHVPDLNGFVRGIHRVLKADGVAVVEAPYLKDLLDCCEFDTIYHEHLCYFSLTALVHCFARQGLTIADVERLPIHGGSLRLFAVRESAGIEPSERVGRLLSEEAGWGASELEPYRVFADRVGRLRYSLRHLLATLKRQGKRLAAYGASAKGSTLLNYCGIGRDTLDFVVDRNPIKQGRFMSGTRLPIFAPEQLLTEQPDATLLLTWNFADEILEQQAEYRRRGGRFIVPVPEPRVLGGRVRRPCDSSS